MALDFQAVEEGFREREDLKCGRARNGMVATQSPPGTRAGVQILKNGGNAVDAAVAAALALSVSEPQASGLGGQTMALITCRNRVVAIDGSSRAPSLISPSGLVKSDRVLGYRATTVPSTPATLFYLQQKYGDLPWPRVIKPAIELAEGGVEISPLQNRLQHREWDQFRQVESGSGLKYFYHQGRPYRAGETFFQPDLARLLKRLSDLGVEEFYRGKTARQIDGDMRENGGLLRYDDLCLIPYPIERKPLKRKINGLQVVTMPPPGAGRTLLFALLMVDHLPPRYRQGDYENLNLLLINILRKSFLERSDRPFDPNFFPQITDTSRMLNSAYARRSLQEIIRRVDRSILPFLPTQDEEKGDTTHLSVVDRRGNGVSLTQSIERVYGSKAAAEGLGFLYNNYLYDFEYQLPDHPFYLRPNFSPWATVAPTMIFQGSDLWMVLGSPGSERIVSVLCQFLLNMIDRRYSLDRAMLAPRFHCSLGGRVSLEAERFPPRFPRLLEEKGFRVDRREDFSFYLGAVQAVLLGRSRAEYQGVADIRRDGTVGGY